MIWNIYKKEFAPTASFAQSFIKPNTVKLKFTYVVTELSHKDAGKQVEVLARSKVLTCIGCTAQRKVEQFAPADAWG